MSFAEIILRIGTAIAGWLIFIGHGLTIAVIHQADCDPSNDQLWRGTLLFGVLTAIGLFFVGRGLAWSHSLRWFALPAALLALYAGYQIAPGLSQTTFGGESLCVIARPDVADLSEFEATRVERIWPVAQFAVFALGLIQTVRYWRAMPAPEA